MLFCNDLKVDDIVGNGNVGEKALSILIFSNSPFFLKQIM